MRGMVAGGKAERSGARTKRGSYEDSSTRGELPTRGSEKDEGRRHSRCAEESPGPQMMHSGESWRWGG